MAAGEDGPRRQRPDRLTVGRKNNGHTLKTGPSQKLKKTNRRRSALTPKMTDSCTRSGSGERNPAAVLCRISRGKVRDRLYGERYNTWCAGYLATCFRVLTCRWARREVERVVFFGGCARCCAWDRPDERTATLSSGIFCVDQNDSWVSGGCGPRGSFTNFFSRISTGLFRSENVTH